MSGPVEFASGLCATNHSMLSGSIYGFSVSREDFLPSESECFKCTGLV